MTMQMIATTKQRTDLATAHRDFISAARFKMCGKNSVTDAVRLAESHGASRRVEALIKAEPGMISAPGGSPETWGGEALSPPAQAEQAFAASLRKSGAVDRMLPDTIQVPLRTHFVVNGAALVADEVNEATAKPVFDLAIDADFMTPKKVAGIVALTKELVRAGGPFVEGLIDRELRASIVTGTDGMVLPDLVTGTTPIASSGNFLEDVSNLLAAATFGADARLYLVLRPEDVAQVRHHAGSRRTRFPWSRRQWRNPRWHHDHRLRSTRRRHRALGRCRSTSICDNADTAGFVRERDRRVRQSSPDNHDLALAKKSPGSGR